MVSFALTVKWVIFEASWWMAELAPELTRGVEQGSWLVLLSRVHLVDLVVVFIDAEQVDVLPFHSERIKRTT
jgi:hypothetical protein